MLDSGLLKQAIQVLHEGGTIIYPTETLWGIGCDATNKTAVDKVSNIKKRAESKGYIMLVDGLEMLSAFVSPISKPVRELISSNIPTTIVFSRSSGLPRNVVRDDGTAAFRVAKTDLCKELIRSFGKPIVSTSANPSHGLPPVDMNQIAVSILDNVDYVINLPDGEQMSMVPSRILSIDTFGIPQIIRE